MAEEFYRPLGDFVEDDTGLFNQKLMEGEDYYTYHRPHGGLGGQTPYERLLQKIMAQPRPPSVNVLSSCGSVISC